jgi:hypothetical protein
VNAPSFLPPNKGRRPRIPRSTFFSLLGFVVFCKQAFFTADPDNILIFASMFLMGAIPLEILERILRGSLMPDPPPKPGDDPP